MCSLLDLPLELVEVVVTHPCLELTDIAHLSATCIAVNVIVSRSWKKIALGRWQWWSNACLSTAHSHNDWYKLCRERHTCEVSLHHHLHQTIPRGVRQYLTDDEELECYGSMVGEKGCCSQIVFECVLMQIMNKNIKDAGNLSHQYYGLCILEYLKRQELKKKWREYFAKDKPLLIHGTILISEWIDPTNGSIESVVSDEVSSIAELTAVQLIPPSARIEEGVASTEGGVSAVDVVKSLHLKRHIILQALNNVMYTTLGYKAADDDYYELENSLIDKVISRRRGIPITLSAVYQATAHLLGVELLPVNFPAHFILKTNVDYVSGEGEVFVDPFNKGQILSQSDCLNLIPFLPVTSPEVFNAVPTYKAVLRMVANIYSRDPFALHFDVGRHWLEESNRWGPLVLPSSVSLQLYLCSICSVCDFTSTVAARAAEVALDLRYNTKQVNWVMSDICEATNPSVFVLTKLQRAQYSFEKRKKALNEPTRVKYRDPNKVLYTVGMIMEHVRYDYKCVIYGWDVNCQMSDQWIQQMGVNQLQCGPTQPFYNVLVEDGTNRYAAQESLVPYCPKEKPGHIVHWEVGKYFKHFNGHKYIPNHALLQKYPD